MIYILVFLLFLIVAVKCDTNSNSSKKVTNNIYIIELFTLILLAGLRKGVGGDTFSYMAYWNGGFYSSIYDLNIASLALLDRFGPGWLILSNLVYTFTNEFYVFQIIHAIIINACVFYFVNKCTKYRFTVVLLYFLTIFFYYNMEIMRQSLANVLILISLIYLMKKKWKMYYLFVVFAITFHASALLFVLLPFCYKRLSKLPELKIVVTIVIAAFSMQTFFSSISLGDSWPAGVEKYSAMHNLTSLGNVHAVVLTILYYYLARYCERCNSLLPEIKLGINLFFYFNLIGLAMPIFVTRYSTVLSIVLYIVMATMVVEHHKTIIKTFVWAEFVCFTLFRAYTIDMSAGVRRASGTYYYYNLFYPYYSIFDNNVESKAFYQFRYNTMNQNE